MAGKGAMSATDAIRKFKEKLNILPMEDAIFVAKLDAAGFFTMNHKDMMSTEKTNADKATYFLDKVVGVDADHYVPMLLTKMVELEGPYERFATDIQRKMSGSSGGSSGGASGSGASGSGASGSGASGSGTSGGSSSGYTSKDYRDCIRKNYTALVDGLPTDQLFVQLFQDGVITDDERADIKLKKLQKDKTMYLLDDVITPSLKAGFNDKYLKLVQVMRKSDNTSAQNLATRLLM